MKKIFANPEMEIKGFELENIVTTSAPIKGGESQDVTANTASVAVNVGDITPTEWVNSIF